MVEVANIKKFGEFVQCGNVENAFKFNDCSHKVDDLFLFQQTLFTLLNFSFEIYCESGDVSHT
jgi:hypothetical protein